MHCVLKPGLDQHDVKLILEVKRFRLHANGFANLLFQFSQPIRFFIEQQVDALQQFDFFEKVFGCRRAAAFL